MFLCFRMRAVERIPGAAPPSAEGDFVRAQWIAVSALDQPVRMSFEQMRFLLGDERSDPNRRLETSFANLFQYAFYVTAESRARLQPVAHCRLVAVVDLNVLQAGRAPGDKVEVVAHLLRGDARTEAIP